MVPQANEPAPARRGDAHMAGIGLMVMSTWMFPMIDANAKWLILSFPVAIVLWSRFAGSMALEWLIVLPRVGLAPLRTDHLRLHLARSATLALGTLFNFQAVKHLPLTTTVTILYSIPLLVALFSPLLLRERLPAANRLPMALGFVGVLLVIQPGLPNFQWEMLYSIATAVAAAAYVMLTRVVSLVSDRRTSLFWTSTFGTVMFAPGLLYMGDYTLPTTVLPWVMLVLLGFFFAGVSHQLLMAAQRRAPAPLLAPYMYTNVVVVVAAGYLVFDDIPDILTVAGICCAIVAGTWLARLDALAARTATEEPPA